MLLKSKILKAHARAKPLILCEAPACKREALDCNPSGYHDCHPLLDKNVVFVRKGISDYGFPKGNNSFPLGNHGNPLGYNQGHLKGDFACKGEALDQAQSACMVTLWVIILCFAQACVVFAF